MAILLSNTFVGTDNASWPSPWSHQFVGGSTGGTVTLLSDRGRLRAHDGSYTTVQADAVGITGTDVLIEATVRFPEVTEQYTYIWARSSGGWDGTEPWHQTSGYCFYAGPGVGSNNEISIEKVVAGSNVAIGGAATISGTFQANVDYRIKFELDGTALRGKMWLLTDQEPAWQIETTDSDYSSGGIATSLLSGATGAARELQYDNFAVNEVVTPEETASEWTAWAETTTDPPAAYTKIRRNGAWVNIVDELIRRGGTWV